jgi:predicted permease
MSPVRYAFRNLAQTPVLTSVAVLSLALGIGANTAIFSIFDQLLLRPLPVKNPAELVLLRSPGPKSGSISTTSTGDDTYVFSHSMLQDLRRLQSGLADLAGHVPFGGNIGFQGNTLAGRGLYVTGGYFPLLGVRPAAGRLLTWDDDKNPGDGRNAVLSYDYWITRFGGKPEVVGQALIVNGEPFTIAGVAPQGFRGLNAMETPEIFVPVTALPRFEPKSDAFSSRKRYWLYVFGRLKPGESLTQTADRLTSVYQGVLRDVELAEQKGASEKFKKSFVERRILLEPGVNGQSNLRENAQTPLLLLLGTTGLVLLIACANIANLLLARAASRAKEIAVRLAVGASRPQLVRQLLTESVLLALAGGMAGLIVSYWTVDALVAALPPDGGVPFRAALDLRVLAFTLGLSLLTGLLFGLYPAFQATNPELAAVLKDQAGQAGGTTGAVRFRKILVSGQVALSLLLLISAGLFLKSLVKVTRIDLGLRVENLITFGLSPELNKYTPERSRAYFEQVEEKLAAIPGVTAVTSSRVPLLAGSNWSMNIKVDGFDPGPDGDSNARFNAIGPQYFATVGNPMLAGREFQPRDGQASPKVAIVNEAFARKFFDGKNPVGRRMARGGGNIPLDIEIVGYVRDAKYASVRAKVPPVFFVPYRQEANFGATNFYVRTALPAEQIVPVIRRAVSELDANLPIETLKTLEAQARESVFAERLLTTLALAFAGLATLLAAIGLYGVLAYMVAQRTREIGLRMALGAQAADVRKLVFREVGLLVGVGAVLGIPAALALGRFAQSLLYEMEGHDPTVISLATILLVVIALLAASAPVWRATRIDPLVALRYE